MLEALKQELYELHLELPHNNLVAWTSGNVSGRDAASGLVVIKPRACATPRCGQSTWWWSTWTARSSKAP